MLDKLNPLKYLLSAGHLVVEGSYYFCLIGAIIGMLLYMYGVKSCKSAPLVSIAVYIIIRMLGAVLNVQ